MGRGNRAYENTLAIALYRAGRFGEVVKLLGDGRDGEDWIVLALAHTQLDEREKSRDLYKKAVAWIEEHRPHDADLQRFVTEAADEMTNER